MNKKVSLTLGTISAIALPAAAVVSCGHQNVPTPQQVAAVHATTTASGTTTTTTSTSSHQFRNSRLDSQLLDSASDHDAASWNSLLGADYISKRTSTFATQWDEGVKSGNKTSPSFKQARVDNNTAMLTELYDVFTANSMVDSARAIVKRYTGATEANAIEFTQCNKKLISKADPNFFAFKNSSGEDSHAEEDDHFFDQYSAYSDGTKLHITGSSPVAMAHAWYEWVKAHGAGMIGWEANSFNETKYKAEIAAEHITTAPALKTSPYEKHYYMNSATAGYSTPWWTPEKWMDWLSWSAIHGYDLMLDYVGHEAIGALLYKEMGFNDDQIRDYYTGPAYATWGRLGNLAGYDVNPYFKTWCKDQVQLQHVVLRLMRKLSIKPIVASFAGFVPKDINSLPGYKDTVITKTHWTKYEKVPSYFLNPYSDDPRTPLSDSDLFKNLSKRFVELYEKEFGPQDFYLADSFEEMTIPDGVKKTEFYEQVGEKLYAGIEEATAHHTKWKGYKNDTVDAHGVNTSGLVDIPAHLATTDANYNQFVDEEKTQVRGEFALKKDGKTFMDADGTNIEQHSASWAFQGWMLGYQRNDWDYEALHSFLKFVPKNKVLVIDEAEDYNQTFWNNGANYNYFRPTPNDPTSGPSFDGARWAYSTIPNMGGNTGITGLLEWYAQSGLDALQTPNHGYLYAYGSAPEGIDNNPVTQELIADMGYKGSEFITDPTYSQEVESITKADIDAANSKNEWLNKHTFSTASKIQANPEYSQQPTDVKTRFHSWLQNYSLNRYGYTWDVWDDATNSITKQTNEHIVNNAQGANAQAKSLDAAKKLLLKYWVLRLQSANSYLDDHPISYWQYGNWVQWTAPSSQTWQDALSTFGASANAYMESLDSNVKVEVTAAAGNTPASIALAASADNAKSEAVKAKLTPLYKDDLYRFTTIYLGLQVDKLIVGRSSDPTEAKAQLAQINELFTIMDKIQREHNTDRLERWLGYVRSWGHTPEQKQYYEQDAIRHITSWYPSLAEYAAKMWSGLIASYYQARITWQFQTRLIHPELKADMKEFNEKYVLNQLWTSHRPAHLGGYDENGAMAQPLGQFKTSSYGATQALEAVKALLNPKYQVPVVGKPADAQVSLASPGYAADMHGVTTTIQVSTDTLKQLAGGALAIYAGGTKAMPKIKDIEIYFGNGAKAKLSATVQQSLIAGDVLQLNFASDIWGDEAQVDNFLRESNNGAEIRITWDSDVAIKPFTAKFFFVTNQHTTDPNTANMNNDKTKAIQAIIENIHGADAAASPSVVVAHGEIHNAQLAS